jgi:hypothetical protein
MTSNAVLAVKAFSNHVASIASARSGNDSKPSENDRAERERLMQEMLSALGLTKPEFLNKLKIDKSTWDRWRSIYSVPHPAHLYALSRFAEQKGRAEASREESTQPSPTNMLLSDHKTWGRLRLVYSHYDWDNAVFNFQNPYKDPQTVLEMALLALKQCSMVYFKKNPAEWAQHFTGVLVNILGKTDAARALSKFCIIDEAFEGTDFAIFNYEAKNENERAGYIWKGGAGERPSDEAKDIYDVMGRGADVYNDLHEKYNLIIQKAFSTIQERSPQDFWANPLQRDELLKIPIIKLGED